MTLQEANKLLDSAPLGNKPSRINPSLTQAQAVKIVRDGISHLQPDSVLSDLMEKRVHQVCRNQRRPRY